MAKQQRNGEREQHWRGVLARFAASGQSVRAFCQRERLPESAFYFWRRTLQQRDAAAASGAVPAFVPVSMQQKLQLSAASIALELGGELTIRFAESASAERIAALPVSALKRESKFMVLPSCRVRRFRALPCLRHPPASRGFPT